MLILLPCFAAEVPYSTAFADSTPLSTVFVVSIPLSTALTASVTLSVERAALTTVPTPPGIPGAIEAMQSNTVAPTSTRPDTISPL